MSKEPNILNQKPISRPISFRRKDVLNLSYDTKTRSFHLRIRTINNFVDLYQVIKPLDMKITTYRITFIY